MKNRNLQKILRTLCLSLFVVSTISGCSTTTKKSRIISLQKNRIQSLKKQVRRQSKFIHTLKRKRWVGSGKSISRASSLKKLDKMISQGMWVSALKQSAGMVKKYPKWLALKRRRAKVFKKMGLTKEARKEMAKIQRLRARRTKKNQVRL